MAIYHSRLPKEYQEVEYIRSTGTQYIDTGIIGNLNTSYKIKCATTQIVQQGVLFGSRTSAANNNISTIFPARIDSSYQNALSDFGNYSITRLIMTNIDVNDILVFFNSKDNRYIKNITKNESASNTDSYSSSITTPTNLYLFYKSSGFAQDHYNFIGKLYSCQIYDNSTLVRDFVPCYRKADNVIGLYDMVNDVFYTNAGSGTFLKGNDKLAKVIDIYKGTQQIIKKYKGNSLFYHRLPSEFQQVEYIESTGTQYIDTGYVANQNLTCTLKYKQTTDHRSKLFGSRITFSNGAYCFYNDGANKLTINYGSTGINLGNDYDNIDIIIKSVISNNKILFYVNNVLSWQDNKYGGTFYSGNMLFGAYNNNGNVALAPNPGVLTLYYCKLYDNGILVRNFMPCYRKSDGVIGLYDLKNDVFYTNAGAGTFLKGNDVL